ncbi:RNA polymerase sigma factor [Pelagerythrobacter sp.]|uniref:RNA polymerase sigma factor n=1 Tax=Pelagerythrobacter sp. TaxID=2800702 RepID=UPI0035B2B36C
MALSPAETEAELIRRTIAGDRLAFAGLARSLIPRLLATAGRMLGNRAEAQDAVQDALASAWVARERLDAARPILPMLTTITLNKCRDRLRRRKVAEAFRLGAGPSCDLAGDEAPSPERAAGDRDALERTRQAIGRLPIRLREALVLVAIDGHSQREAAELLNVSEKTVETRIYRARRILREEIGKP